MIKGKTRKNTYRAIYRLLDRVSPMPFDCGSICGAACCMIDELDREEGLDMGMYLMPGEDKIHNKKDPWLSWETHSSEEYDFPPSFQGDMFFVKCRGPAHCKRALRPLQCRTFPLKPILTDPEETAPENLFYREGGCPLVLIYNNDALPYCCPLIEGNARLNEDFIRATYLVWKHLIRDPLIYDYVKSNGECR